MKRTGERWLDIGLGWLVKYEHDDHWLDFRAYECAGEETHPNAGRKLFLKKEWRHSGEHAETIEDAEVTISGYVKWDGCSEMDGPKPHFCGAGDVAEYGKVMSELHKLCLLLPAVDHDCAGYPVPNEGGEE